MIYPKIFELVKDNSNVQNHLGVNPVRFFPFANKPQNIKDSVYAVWQTISGDPQNTLCCPPQSDIWLVQVDVYGNEADDVRNAAGALINALETKCLLQSIGQESRDFETKRYRYSFDVQIIQNR